MVVKRARGPVEVLESIPADGELLTELVVVAGIPRVVDRER